MRLAVMMALQSLPVAGPPLPADMRPVAPATAAVPCGTEDARGDIVVCGRDRTADRLPRLDPTRYAERPIRARTTIGTVDMAAQDEQGTMPDGKSAPRAMLHFKTKF